MESRTLYSRSRSNWLPILISLVFVLIGVWMIRDGQWVGWLELGLFGLGVIILIASALPQLNWLRLEPERFQIRQLRVITSVAWSEVERFFLTSDGQMVIYERIPDPNVPPDPNADEDEHYSYFPDTYGLTASELLELLNSYKHFADRPQR